MEIITHLAALLILAALAVLAKSMKILKNTNIAVIIRQLAVAVLKWEYVAYVEVNLKLSICSRTCNVMIAIV